MQVILEPSFSFFPEIGSRVEWKAAGVFRIAETVEHPAALILDWIVSVADEQQFGESQVLSFTVGFTTCTGSGQTFFRRYVLFTRTQEGRDRITQPAPPRPTPPKLFPHIERF